jgi:ribosome recycling factor
MLVVAVIKRVNQNHSFIKKIDELLAVKEAEIMKV